MKRKKIKIAPSILSADFARLGEQVREAEEAGADYLHVDVMDGHFVPNISIGIPVVASLKKITKVPLDVHLMIEKPELYIKDFKEAGADILTVHVEACNHLHKTLHEIRQMGIRAGVTLNPSTPLSALEEVLAMVDMVLIMSVNPGFGGQSFIESSLDKVSRLRQMLEKRNIDVEIEIDGGITKENALAAVKAGADVLVAGSAIFNAKTGISAALKEIRKAVC